MKTSVEKKLELLFDNKLIHFPTNIYNFLQRFHRASRHILNIMALLGALYLSFNHILENYKYYELFKFITSPVIVLVYSIYIFLGFIISSSFLSFLVTFTFDFLFFIPLFIIPSQDLHPAHVVCVRQLAYYFRRYIISYSYKHLTQNIISNPAKFIAGSFLGVIIIGTFVLLLPISISVNYKPSFLNALFTATSAVCVTGLIVEDTSIYFSFFGQIMILILIQIGGLGIMTLSTGGAFLLGKKLALSERSLLQVSLEAKDINDLYINLKMMYRWTFIIELIGAIILAIKFKEILNCDWYKAIYYGLFHSISAFCNAGFSLFSNSFVDFKKDFVINLTIITLIILGGLGFGVLKNIIIIFRRINTRFDTHSFLVIKTTIILLLLGTFFYFVFERKNPELAELSVSEKLLVALFASVTARTAGFNTLNYANLSEPTYLLTLLLMFIGASPSSTGGGIKTTTFATIILATIANIRGKDSLVINGRSIPKEVVHKAFTITTLAIFFIFFSTLILLTSENIPFKNILFETISAISTVGLSMGITSKLSSIGKLIIIILMFIGRIGPLTVSLIAFNKEINLNVKYPHSHIWVG